MVSRQRRRILKDFSSNLLRCGAGESVCGCRSIHCEERGGTKEPDKADLEQFLALRVLSLGGQLVPLTEFVSVVETSREHSIYHKDLLPVVYVTGDMAGQTDSPLFGLFEISDTLARGLGLEQWFLQQPANPYEYSLKWDGEWQVTYDTFRGMGIAYGIGLLLIYLLVVAQFRSYLMPLVIMAPIPLTIIGIMPGHAILGAQFTESAPRRISSVRGGGG